VFKHFYAVHEENSPSCSTHCYFDRWHFHHSCVPAHKVNPSKIGTHGSQVYKTQWALQQFESAFSNGGHGNGGCVCWHKWHLDGLTHHRTTMQQIPHCLQWDVPYFLQKLPISLGRSQPHLIHPSLDPTLLITPNGIQILSTALPQYTLQTDRPTLGLSDRSVPRAAYG